MINDSLPEPSTKLSWLWIPPYTVEFVTCPWSPTPHTTMAPQKQGPSGNNAAHTDEDEVYDHLDKLQEREQDADWAGID